MQSCAQANRRCCLGSCSTTPPYSQEARSLIEPTARLLVSKSQGSCSHPHSAEDTALELQPHVGFFYVGSGDSNSGPHVSAASALTHWAIYIALLQIYFKWNILALILKIIGREWSYITLIPALKRQKLFVFKARLSYMNSSKLARAIWWERIKKKMG